MTDNLSITDHIYFTFHPWAQETPDESRCCYWITLVAVTILSAGIVPIAYYLISCCLPTPSFTRPFSLVTFDEGSPLNEMQEKVVQTAIHDCPAHNHSWQSSFKEKNVSFGAFTQKRGMEPPQQKPAILQLIGTFTEQEKLMAKITTDFMQATHQTEVFFNDTPFPLEKIEGIEKREKYDRGTYFQYLAESMLVVVQRLKHGENVDMVGFTSADLFTNHAKLTNFVLGCGHYESGTGIWSKDRLTDRNPAVTLRRMMWLASHEYGHMRYLSHCTDFACLMNGGMSVREIDGNPLLLCSQDAAKVAWMCGISLKEYYTRLLAFYTQFNEKYSIKLDLSSEINLIQKKLTSLN